MKLDSESYHHTSPPHVHDTKVIVHNDNPFILAKDNHFMIDMLNIDKEAIKEGNHGLTSHIERKSAKGTGPPKQCLDMEDSINRKKRDDECMEALYSSPTSGFEMVVKEDFYTDKIVTKVELPKNRVCIEDDPCHIVKDISIDEGVQSSYRSLADKEVVSPLESSISNQTPNNGYNESTRAVAGSAGVDELKYSVFDSSVTSIDKDQAYSVSVLHNDFDGKVTFVGSFDNGGKLDATVISSLSAKVTENSADQASVFHNDCDGKGYSVSSINSESNLATNESVSSNIASDVTESSAVSESDVHNDCDAKGLSVSSENCRGKLDTTESVLSNISPEVIASPAVPESYVNNDCDGKGSSASSDNCKGKLDKAESIVHSLATEVTENQLPPSEEIKTDSLQVDSSSQIFRDDQSSDNFEGKLDKAESIVHSLATEVTENQLPPSEEITTDLLQVDSSSQIFRDDQSSDNCEGKLDKTESIVHSLATEVTENQLPPSEEIMTDSLQMDSSSHIFRDDQKQSVDGQKIQAISEESNSVSTTLSFPSEVSVASNDHEETPANRKVPSGVITFNFDKEAASTSGRNDDKKTTHTQQLEMAQNGPRTEEAMIDGATASARSSFLQLIQGESNLSGSALLSGPLANSGHIPYSGSISLRSDSSTTSARSFAFPILQSEWNSSPVKMAKADRRHLRKHRGWKMGLLCCRF